MHLSLWQGYQLRGGKISCLSHMSSNQELALITDTKRCILPTTRSCSHKGPQPSFREWGQQRGWCAPWASGDMQELDQKEELQLRMGKSREVLSEEEAWGSRSCWGENLYNQRKMTSQISEDIQVSDFRMKCMTWFDSQKEAMIDSKTEWKQCFGKINLVGHERFTGAAEGSGTEWRQGNQVRPNSSNLARK